MAQDDDEYDEPTVTVRPTKTTSTFNIPGITTRGGPAGSALDEYYRQQDLVRQRMSSVTQAYQQGIGTQEGIYGDLLGARDNALGTMRARAAEALAMRAGGAGGRMSGARAAAARQSSMSSAREGSELMAGWAGQLAQQRSSIDAARQQAAQAAMEQQEAESKMTTREADAFAQWQEILANMPPKGKERNDYIFRYLQNQSGLHPEVVQLLIDIRGGEEAIDPNSSLGYWEGWRSNIKKYWG